MFLLEPSQIAKSLEWVYIGQLTLIQSIGFGKCAVIAFLLRIQDRAQSRKNMYLSKFLYFIGISNFVINIAEIGVILFSCSPTAKLWNPLLLGNCNHLARTNYMGYFQGCMDHCKYGWNCDTDCGKSLGCRERHPFGWLPSDRILESPALTQIENRSLSVDGWRYSVSLDNGFLKHRPILINYDFRAAAAGILKTVYINLIAVEADATCISLAFFA